MNPIVSEEKFLALQAEYPQMPYYQVTEAGEGMPAAYKIPAGWMIDRCGWKGKRLGRPESTTNRPWCLSTLEGPAERIFCICAIPFVGM